MSHHLTNIPDGTLLYMQPEGGPRLGPLRYTSFQADPYRPSSFTVIDPRYPSRTEIDSRQLVGYYRKHVGPIDGAFFDEKKALEILFIAEHPFQKDRSMKDVQADYNRGRAFKDNYTCDDCYPWACRCKNDEAEETTLHEKAKVFLKDIDKAGASAITERMDGLETLLKEADPRLEALRDTFEEIKKHMSDIRALARALDWAERFPPA